MKKINLLKIFLIFLISKEIKVLFIFNYNSYDLLLRIIIEGTIQGIGFRPFIYRTAIKNNISGFIRNNEDGTIEIAAKGTKSDIDIFLNEVYHNKPLLAYYTNVKIEKLNDKDQNPNYCYDQFLIFPSSNNRKFPFSMIPPDISICNECLADIYNENDKRRFHYPFTSCTQCGPRYAILKRMPYDRNGLSISNFSLCNKCVMEYNNPSDRRFRSETICCKNCGPKYYIIDKEGTSISTSNPFLYTSKLIADGSIVAVKGIGGFHIASSAFDNESISKLRLIKNRKNKPFAVMARDIDTIKTFANLDIKEEELLKSYIKPIVLLTKGNNYFLSPLISPNLHNIGVMLPYSGLHNLILNNKDNSVIVITSANLKNQPLITVNSEAVKKLNNFVDYFLLHNLDIISKSEDSVVKYVYNNLLLLRRSRGYVPNPLYLNKKSRSCILALGSELNLVFAIVIENKCYVSNYIGDIINIENYLYLQNSLKHFFYFLNQKPKIIVCDLHPTLNTTRLAYNMKNSDNIIVQQQHHHSHILSLMAEHSIDEVIGIVCDGTGYGDDGSMWGGEIITSNGYKYERSGHLMEQLMIGGDKATYYPLRMVLGILYNKVDHLEDFIYNNLQYFPNGSKEIKIIFDEIILNNKNKNNKNKKFKTTMTTSTGRILDAVSSLLGICYERTYEGEPALKLESAALNGHDVLHLSPIISHNILDTTVLLQNIYENRKRFSIKDLAYSAHMYLANGLAEIAIDKALSSGIKKIGFSGGVAYNSIITKTLAETIRKTGIEFLAHKIIPPGDSGISIGQAYSALFRE
jgi:hydrogenase maturation protein HypF